MKLRSLFMVLCAVGYIFSAAAQEKEEYSLVVYKTGGNSQAFSLETFDKLTFTATDLQVWTGNQTPVEVSLDEIAKIVFGMAPVTGAEAAVAAAPVEIRWQPGAGRVQVSYTVRPASITVVNLQGATVRRVVPQERVTDISVSGLPAGVYIVCVQTREGLYSSKFVKQ